MKKQILSFVILVFLIAIDTSDLHAQKYYKRKKSKSQSGIIIGSDFFKSHVGVHVQYEKYFKPKFAGIAALGTHFYSVNIRGDFRGISSGKTSDIGIGVKYRFSEKPNSFFAQALLTYSSAKWEFFINRPFVFNPGQLDDSLFIEQMEWVLGAQVKVGYQVAFKNKRLSFLPCLTFFLVPNKDTLSIESMSMQKRFTANPKENFSPLYVSASFHIRFKK